MVGRPNHARVSLKRRQGIYAGFDVIAVSAVLVRDGGLRRRLLRWGRIGAVIIAIGLLTNFVLRGVVFAPKKSKKLGFQAHDRTGIKQLVLRDKAVEAVKRQPGKEPSLSRRKTVAAVAKLWKKSETRCWDELALKREAVKDVRPILVFVNTRSGGQQGVEVIQEMRQLLHRVQVVDLRQETPDAALAWWGRTGVQFRVLVCGGDGTVGWVLGVLERLRLEYTPPVAILPLGTGNDLGRVMGWGGGFTGGSVEPILRRVGSAHVALLDRWQVTCRDQRPRSTSMSPLRRGLTKALTKKGDSQERKSMVLCNYFGIGVDAAVALDFHTMRERSPHLFVSRAVNKIWYAKSGAMSTIDKIWGGGSIREKITLEVDGKEIDLPDDLEGVIVLNIASFGGGTDLWGPDRAFENVEEDGASDADGSERSGCSGSPQSGGGGPRASCVSPAAVLAQPSMQDRKLEVVGVHGAAQLGAAQVGLYTADRLAQGRVVRIENKVEIAVEVDGEPWVFAKDGEVEIAHKSQAFMLQTSEESDHGVATDVVDWALQRDIIDLEQRDKMMMEIARRVQVHQSSSNLKVLG